MTTALSILASQCALPTVIASGADPLEPHSWKHRPLVVVAPSPTDARLVTMTERVADQRSAFQERDMVLLVAADGSETSQALRRHFDANKGSFGVYLVGKDGGTKLRASKVVDLREVFALIDGMPMRRDEMRKR